MNILYAVLDSYTSNQEDCKKLARSEFFHKIPRNS